MPYIFGLEDFHIDKIVSWNNKSSGNLELSNVAFNLELNQAKPQQLSTFRSDFNIWSHRPELLMSGASGYEFPTLFHLSQTNQIVYMNGDEMSWFCLKFFDAESPTTVIDNLIIPREDY